jgi:outer membrane lipoprotein-sorting protein
MKAHQRFLLGLLLVAACAQVAPSRAAAQGTAELETLKSAVSNMEKTILELK